MIVKIVEYDGTETLISAEALDVSIEDYLDAYKNISKSPVVGGFIDYLRYIGVIVELIEPYVMIF
mgnify:FL=1